MGIESLEVFISDLVIWLQANILTLDTAFQLVSVALLFFVARYPAKIIRTYFDNHPATNYGERKAKESIAELALPASWCVFVWFTVIIARELSWPNQVLHIAASLLSAWVVIRFTAGFVRQAVLARFISIAAWVIAALSILDLLEPTIAVLDKLGFTLGELRLSLLVIIKGVLALAIMLWLAVTSSRAIEKRIYRATHIEPSLQVLFSKLVKISLVVFAIFIGFGSVGIDMSAFAVFGGAIGLGIGFGLQKVVSNLICGVILLLDRSIKPGDVIALPAENTFGKVNRLEARCVSVLTRDGEEHLIPNEDFITQKVENWSYTDRNIRLKIPVGISYKSDPRKALDILLNAAEKQDRVLETPAPVARLTDFSDNYIQLELRVWIRDPEDGVTNVRSDILLEIWDQFKSTGIEIPFPQRDIHIKSDEYKSTA